MAFAPVQAALSLWPDIDCTDRRRVLRRSTCPSGSAPDKVRSEWLGPTASLGSRRGLLPVGLGMEPFLVRPVYGGRRGGREDREFGQVNALAQGWLVGGWTYQNDPNGIS